MKRLPKAHEKILHARTKNAFKKFQTLTSSSYEDPDFSDKIYKRISDISNIPLERLEPKKRHSSALPFMPFEGHYLPETHSIYIDEQAIDQTIGVMRMLGGPSLSLYETEKYILNHERLHGAFFLFNESPFPTLKNPIEFNSWMMRNTHRLEEISSFKIKCEVLAEMGNRMDLILPNSISGSMMQAQALTMPDLMRFRRNGRLLDVAGLIGAGALWLSHSTSFLQALGIFVGYSIVKGLIVGGILFSKAVRTQKQIGADFFASLDTVYEVHHAYGIDGYIYLLMHPELELVDKQDVFKNLIEDEAIICREVFEKKEFILERLAEAERNRQNEERIFSSF